MSHPPYSARRARLLEVIGDGVAVLPTAPERVRNRDAHHPYRFDSYFWYLTGFPEPEAVLVLLGGSMPQSILFCRAKDDEREIWDGYRHGPEAAREAFAFDATYPLCELESRLTGWLAEHPALWYALGQDPAWDRRMVDMMEAVRKETRAGKRPPAAVHDVRVPLDGMRRIKDDHEIRLMKQAAAIAAAGHVRAMRACRPGMAEYALEAELGYEFRRRGAESHAYTPIVAGGANACILHYTANDKLLCDQTLVLVDAGCELGGYASDITRTYPVGGRFSPAQRDVYAVVLAAQQAALAAVRPGSRFLDPHRAAVRVLAQGLCDLGLLQGSVDEVVDTETYRRFYMHRTSHWLGLDVHDVGEYKQGDDWATLASGMVLTIEPGLYIRPAQGVPQALAGIGIRIEDDVLVTPQGCEMYTEVPRSIADIEQVMARD